MHARYVKCGKGRQGDGSDEVEDEGDQEETDARDAECAGHGEDEGARIEQNKLA